jgi:hypothetical protein
VYKKIDLPIDFLSLQTMFAPKHKNSKIAPYSKNKSQIDNYRREFASLSLLLRHHCRLRSHLSFLPSYRWLQQVFHLQLVRLV